MKGCFVEFTTQEKTIIDDIRDIKKRAREKNRHGNCDIALQFRNGHVQYNVSIPHEPIKLNKGESL